MIIFILINDDKDGNSRNKSGLSSILAVWTANEWGSLNVIITIIIILIIIIIVTINILKILIIIR